CMNSLFSTLRDIFRPCYEILCSFLSILRRKEIPIEIFSFSIIFFCPAKSILYFIQVLCCQGTTDAIETVIQTLVQQLAEGFLLEISGHDRSSCQQIDLPTILLESDRDTTLRSDGIMLGLVQINIGDVDPGAIGQIQHRYLPSRSIRDLQMDSGS